MWFTFHGWQMMAGMCWLIPLEVQNHLKNEIEHSIGCPSFACFSDGSWSWALAWLFVILEETITGCFNQQSSQQCVAQAIDCTPPTLSGMSPLDVAESTEHVTGTDCSQSSYTNLHILKTCFDWHIRNGALVGLNGVQIQCLSKKTLKQCKAAKDVSRLGRSYRCI